MKMARFGLELVWHQRMGKMELPSPSKRMSPTFLTRVLGTTTRSSVGVPAAEFE